MKKKFEDIIPKNKIIKIPLDRRKVPSKEYFDDEKFKPSKPSLKSKKSKSVVVKKLSWGVLFILILIAIFGVFSTILQSAEIIISPKLFPVTVDSNYSATKDSSEGVIFQIMSVTASKSFNNVPFSTSTKTAKSFGRVKIQNNTSSQQILVSGTRLQKKDGLIYKILKTVTVPGSKSVNGIKKAGEIEVGVEAAEFGENYNFKIPLNPETFTIPGLKNNVIKFRDIFAKPSSDFTGGEKSTLTIIDSKSGNVSTEKIKQELTDNALLTTNSQIPSGYFFFEGGYVVKSLDYQVIDPKSSEIKATVLVQAIIFEKESLINKLTEKIISSDKLKGTKISLDSTDLSNLTFSFIKKPLDLDLIDSIIFKLKGDFVAFGKVSEDSIKSRLVGVKLSNMNTVLKTVAEIEKADIIIRPFWKKTIPKDIRQIKVSQKLD